MNKRYLTFAINKVIFPGTSGILTFSLSKIIEALKLESTDDEKVILVPKKATHVMQQDMFQGRDDLSMSTVLEGDFGTLIEIEQLLVDPFEFSAKLSYRAISQVKVSSVTAGDEEFLYFAGTKKPKFASCSGDDSLAALFYRAKSTLEEYIKVADINKSFGDLFDIDRPMDIMDTVAGKLQNADLFAYYEADTTEDKLLEFIKLVAAATEFQMIDDTVDAKVKESIDQNQREYYVREQIRALTAEIDGEDETEEYYKKIDEMKASDEVKNKLRKEARRINQTAPASPEMALLKNYLDTVLELPWGICTEDNEDLTRAEEVLNHDHYGLEKVKERLIEALAVRKLSKGGRSPIICLVGPPGIGKTSIARSIATAMNKNYVRLSFGGVRDEAEIRGHRKTYVGAMPGRIITGIKTAGSMNPVFLMDEIDKMASDYKGDPASALLEVLDPEQNVNFRDNFVEMPFDLSKVLFIVTANTLDTVSRPLLDRMEIIEMSGYTDEEKLQIAKQHLIVKTYSQTGVKPEWVNITDDAVMAMISDYTRESGVRGLEKCINAVMRKVAKRFVSEENPQAVTVTKDNLSEFLGEAKFIKTDISKEDEVGVVTGLAWTSVGGDTLSIEVAITDGKGELLLTGSLGDVMKESARIALSYCRGRAEELNLDKSFFKEHDIHIHVPEGATPKDGPSAGITIATALMSALSQKKVKQEVAMTGELTLLGKVLPIGGLKEKSLAAMRAGISTIYLPEENRRDYKELPEIVKNKLDFVFINNVKTVISKAINW